MTNSVDFIASRSQARAAAHCAIGLDGPVTVTYESNDLYRVWVRPSDYTPVMKAVARA